MSENEKLMSKDTKQPSDTGSVESRGYASFDEWYQEVEGSGLRAERLTSDVDELRAAFDARQSESIYLRDLLRRLMSEVRPYTQPSLVQYDAFPAFNEAANHVG
jgi:hypothetical protein